MKFSDFVKMWIEQSNEADGAGKAIFVEYSAHVKVLHIRIFSNGWKSGTDPDIILDFKAW